MADEVLTYYGYEQPNSPDWDKNSWNGIGDRENNLVPGYSVALSQSARQQLLGSNSSTSTGQEFTYNGKTYRDDDTSPQTFSNIDVYSPGGVPGSATYNPSVTTPLGSTSNLSLNSIPSLSSLDSLSSPQHQQDLATLQEPTSNTNSQPQSQSQGDSLLSGFKKAFPQYSSVDLSKIMEKVAAIHPNIEPARLEELWSKSNSWQELAQEEKQAQDKYKKSFDVLKQFYEGGSDGGQSSSES